MLAVFVKEVYGKEPKFYSVVDGKFFTVYVGKDKEVHLLTAKNGKKYFLANLMLKRSKKGKFYLEVC